MMNKQLDQTKLYDVAVVGGGPAGLTAALYLARAKYRVLVIEKEHFGGQITITSEVVNYPGVALTDGKALTETMRKQAESFGAEFLLGEVTGLSLDGDVKTVHTSKGDIPCFGVLLATGAHPRMIGFEGEDAFRGHGVAYCATCDGEFFTDKEVFVVGGGFAAAEESVFLTKYAKHVTVLVREADFTCAKATADCAKHHEKITVLYNTEVLSVSGDSALNKICYKNNATGEVTEYRAENGDFFGVFVFAGYEPETALVKEFDVLNDQGYVVTDRDQKTAVDGLYAAGDVCVKNLRQVVTAVGDGAIAATELEKYAASLQKKTGLVPQLPKAAQKEEPKAAPKASAKSTVFSEDIAAQLDTVFSRMTGKLVLKLYLDDRGASEELRGYMEAMAERTDKISVVMGEGEAEDRPCVKVCRPDGSETGLAFHGVPGGHEFTSFVLGLYNAAGPGQPMDETDRADIGKLEKDIRMQVLVSLSCTMCPELVVASQRVAAENAKVTTEVYDVNLYPHLKERYNVMSVPCLVINEEKVTFGKKNLRQLLDIL
ncbi:MAG: FAD-dependent oxidoreductase, partial [Firmicutes bacterium]|nr:FAD-dependent oxidoreductase [Bacillota bacterium]